MRRGLARRLLAGVAAVLAAAAGGVVLRGVLPASDAASRPSRAAGQRAPDSFSLVDAQSRKVPPGASLIAVPKARSIGAYPRPWARRTRRLRPRAIEGQRVPLRFMLVGRRKGWVRVQLPTRPNRSTAWLRRRDVVLAATPYRLIVDRKRHRLSVINRNRLTLRVPIAVGASLTPTPRGRYYVTDLIRSRDPFYGPYALGLSAHSPVLTSYAGGNGQLGIHGTNQPWSIGRDVSHGCIRVGNDSIRRLAKVVPIGTPVEIR